MLTNTKDSFGSLAKFFHWTIAILIIGNLICGFFMKGLSLLNYHKIAGLTVLFLFIFRFIFFIFSVKPQLPQTIPLIERFAAFIVKYLLFLLMAVLPITGWIMSTAYGVPPTIAGHSYPFPYFSFSSADANMAKFIHNSLAYSIIVILLMHVGGALKHHFIYKDNILRRMLPFSKNK